MKPIIEFYAKLLHYIQEDYEVNGYAEEILALAEKAEPTLREVTLESITFLEKCVNHPSEVPETGEDDRWLETKEDFVSSAFRDLSSLRDPRAMELWHKIKEEFFFSDDGDLYVWSKKTKSRPDGSAVIVLHVSDEGYFDHMLSSVGYEGLLDEGALFRNAGPQQ